MKPELRQRISSFIDRNKALFLLSYFAIYLPWFGHLEKTVTTHFHVIHTALDDYIPFCEYFIIPYLLWFGYVGWGIGYFYLKDRSEYFRLCAMLFTGMTIFLIVSTIYPNGHYLRPTTFARDNIFVHIVKWLYASDTATNLFPSIHVYNSIAVNIAVWRSDAFKHKHATRCGSAILMVSIILSTMFLKQHSVFDVVTGMITAAGMYMTSGASKSAFNPSSVVGYRPTASLKVISGVWSEPFTKDSVIFVWLSDIVLSRLTTTINASIEIIAIASSTSISVNAARPNRRAGAPFPFLKIFINVLSL